MNPVSVRAEAVSPERITLVVALQVHNPNSFSLAVTNVAGTLALASGAELGRASSESRLALAAEATTPVALTLALPWQNLPALAPFALTGADVPYRFSGTARVGGEQLNSDVPFVLEGKLTQAQLIALGLRGLSAN